jgi:hypothetical protein
MGMVTIQSNIKLLGNATINNSKGGKSVTYTLFEFENGEIIKNISVEGGMDNFLERTIKTNEPQTLFLKKKWGGYDLVGLKIGEKAYVADVRGYHVFFGFIIGIPLIPVFGLGFLILFAAVGAFNTLGIVNEIVAQNPNAQRI